MDRRAGNRNAAKKQIAETDGPWRGWKTKERHARAIRWIETYCIPPKGYGAGKPIRLAAFQKEWLEEVLADGCTSACMEVPRGNGKSTFLAAFALWALFDDDETGQPQIPIVATTMGQAVKSVYGVAVSMAGKHPELVNRHHRYNATGQWRLVNPFNEGEMSPVSNDPDGLQGLDPSLAVCDEIGFMPIESWDSLLLASGKRPRSLVVGIGTPGFDRESALWHLRSKVEQGETLPGFRFKEYAAPEGCDIYDEKFWFEANPALAEGYMNVDALRTAVALSPEAHFRIFRLGQWVDGVESWLGDDGRKIWRGLADPWEMEESAPTWLGVDVGLKHDSTAVCWIQQRDKRLHVKTKIWMPRDDGRLDVSDAMQFIRELGAIYDLKGVAYDPRFFDLPAQQLADEGYPMLEFPQSLERLSPAVGATYEAIKRSELSHDGDEQFETQVLNAVARYNERGFTLAKSKSKDRIDSAVAMCMAFSLAHKPADSEVFVAWG